MRRVTLPQRRLVQRRVNLRMGITLIVGELMSNIHIRIRHPTLTSLFAEYATCEAQAMSMGKSKMWELDVVYRKLRTVAHSIVK